GSWPLTIETPESIAMQVVNALFYGLPVDQLQTFRERVNAVTVDDVQRVAKTYLRPDRLSVVLVGNAKAFASQLAGVGFGSYETVEVGELDLTAANFKRGGARAAAGGGGAASGGRPAGRAGRARLAGRPSVPAYQQAPAVSRPPQGARTEDAEKAKALLDQAIAAKGGLGTLRGIKTIVAKQKLTNQGATTETVNYIEYPDHFRIEAGGTVQGFDGAVAWAHDQRGVHDLPTTREARASLRRDVIALLLAAKDGTLTTRLLPDIKDAEGRVTHTLELSGRDLNPVV